jgi:hypothetical protein
MNASPSVLDCPLDSDGSAERRGALRRPSRLRGLWWPIRFFSSEISQGEVRDYSTHGLALTVPEPEEPGTFLVLRTIHPEGAVARAFRLQVIRASRMTRNGWVLGCRFDRPLGDDDLAIFTALPDAALPD